MRITYDPAKRLATLRDCGLDFEAAAALLSGPRFTKIDDRRDYGEDRYQTVANLAGALVMVVWTRRGEAFHIISMRRCNERERRQFADRLV